MNKGSLIGCIILTAFLAFMLIFAFEVLNQNYRIFIGEETFGTLKEAQIFQTKLVEEAEKVGASVNSIDISITSPPNLTFKIMMPTDKEFRYGERLLSDRDIRLGTAAGIAMAAMMLFLIWFVMPLYDRKELG